MRPDIAFFVDEVDLVRTDGELLLDLLAGRYANLEDAQEANGPIIFGVRQYQGGAYWLEPDGEATLIIALFLCLRALQEALGESFDLFGLYVRRPDNDLVKLNDIATPEYHKAISPHYVGQLAKLQTQIIARKEKWGAILRHIKDPAWPNGIEIRQQ